MKHEDLFEMKGNKAMSRVKGFTTKKKISDEKALLMEEIKEAVTNLALARKGKLKLKSARDLYNEL
jgi:hypothetical protein